MTALGFGLAATAPRPTVLAAAQAAEAGGYRTFWLNHPPPDDALPPLAAAAGATSDIGVGVGVIPVSARTAGSILDGIADVRLPIPRLRLGIGSGTGPGPLGRVREAVEELRRGTDAEIVVAALGPGMCRLAGEIGDAVLLSQVTPPGARSLIDIVFEAADAAQRARPDVYVYVRTALGEPGIAALEREARVYASLPVYAAAFERLGTGPLDAAIRARSDAELREGIAPWVGLVDEVVLRALTADDSEADVLAVLEAASGQEAANGSL